MLVGEVTIRLQHVKVSTLFVSNTSSKKLIQQNIKLHAHRLAVKKPLRSTVAFVVFG
jgi:hypothetical protein